MAGGGLFLHGPQQNGNVHGFVVHKVGASHSADERDAGQADFSALTDKGRQVATGICNNIPCHSADFPSLCCRFQRNRLAPQPGDDVPDGGLQVPGAVAQLCGGLVVGEALIAGDGL